MIDLGRGLKLVTDDELQLLARYHIEEYLKQSNSLPVDNLYVSPEKLSESMGSVGSRTIRRAIQDGHYGKVDSVTKRCIATVTECRAWHFGGKQDAQTKKATARSNRLYGDF